MGSKFDLHTFADIFDGITDTLQMLGIGVKQTVEGTDKKAFKLKPEVHQIILGKKQKSEIDEVWAQVVISKLKAEHRTRWDQLLGYLGKEQGEDLIYFVALLVVECKKILGDEKMFETAIQFVDNITMISTNEKAELKLINNRVIKARTGYEGNPFGYPSFDWSKRYDC